MGKGALPKRILERVSFKQPWAEHVVIDEPNHDSGWNACLFAVYTHAVNLLAHSGHYSRDWSEYVNVIGVISEPFDREFR